MSTRIDRVEVVTRSGRRRWTDADKQKILQETLVPGETVMAVAKRHGIGTGLIYTWRRQALIGAVTGFVPVAIEPEAEVKPVPELPKPMAMEPARTGMIEIELAGGIRLRVDDHVSGSALRRVLAALEPR
jgi:transposase